ncbi:NAD(P)/FAD-dependent oxidoreductase [Sanguibacter antarcticus]|uniref:Sulfide:quinone oxidoreductase n=1 Tax=Sanguibacter antarcticus TaxID=372484 RepID=A0A2A9E9C5_9MICO|nr:FAD/NAD(P)-binding oxidoreductase [Sanguibacter antarcticus]PFG34839.1 sulfide:quinone oxidoreductase [Sanguibacter antarcticus]
MVPRRQHDVVIVGGGNAGLSLAGRLVRDGAKDVVVIEPERVHHYRPMLSYVAGGEATLDQLRRPQERVTPRGVRWHAGTVVAVDPERSVVRLAGGESIGYTDLVLCPGSQVDWDAIPGSEAAVRTPHAATSYLPDSAVDTWSMLSSLTSGRAVFVVGGQHVPCAPVALKPLFLAAEHWRREGVREQIEIDLLVEGDRLVDHARADRRLRDAAAEQGVRVRFGATVASVDAAARTLEVRARRDGTAAAVAPTTVTYDALYLAPPHRAPAWIAESGLACTADGGFLSVDPQTLQHVEHPNVWGLGDVAEVDALPSGGALRRQVPVVASNISARRTGAPMKRYDGYSIAPVAVSRRRLLLAEFDRAGRNQPSVPFPDLVRPRLSTWAFDRYLEPHIYFRQLLQGKVS